MKITTLCYLEEDEKWLMLYRNKKKEDPNAGKWIGVGGKLEPGEAPDECMLREVEEETGLRVTGYEFLGVISFISDEWEDEYMMLYRADAWKGTMKKDCPEGELRWIEKKEVLSLPLWEGDRLFLTEMLNGKKKIHMKLSYRGEELVQAVHF